MYDDAGSVPAVAFTDVNQPGVVGEQNCRTVNYVAGRLVKTIDRGGESVTCYDGRGRVVEVAKRPRAPDGSWTTQWFQRRASFDGADRPKTESTGASVDMPRGLLSSTVTTQYSQRGAVRHVDSSYGALVESVARDADGLVTEIKYGDGAHTTTSFTFNDLRRLRNPTTYRSHNDEWSAGSPDTQQMLLQDEEFVYDRVGNPLEIRDWRNPDEWPTGSKPVNRRMRYDDLYRLSNIEYQYTGGVDQWRDPFAAEVSDNTRPQPSPRARFVGGDRPLQQTFAYDWVGNTSSTSDDQHAFYDRSLGEIANEGYQLASAQITSGQRAGRLSAQYDQSGNLQQMEVYRRGDCTDTTLCPNGDEWYQRYEYKWDEVGRLVEALRYERPNPVGGGSPERGRLSHLAGAKPGTATAGTCLFPTKGHSGHNSGDCSMTVMRVTGWFSRMFEPVALVKALGVAADSLEGGVSLSHKGSGVRCTTDDVKAIIADQSRSDSGEIKWEICGANGRVGGKICWPNFDWRFPGTLELDVVVETARGTRRAKRRVFYEASELLPLLGALFGGVAAKSLLVEPARLPSEIQLARYDRFARLHGKVDLPNVDWIFGLRKTSDQADKLEQARDLFAQIYDEAGFRLWAVSRSPIRYDSELEMARLKRIEAVMGLTA